MDKLRADMDAIENNVAQGDMSAAQVFTQMRQMVEAASTQQTFPHYGGGHEEPATALAEHQRDSLKALHHIEAFLPWNAELGSELATIRACLSRPDLAVEQEPVSDRYKLPAGFRAWLDAVVTVANDTGMAHDEVIPTWPHYTDDDRKMFANHPELRVGDVMELDALVAGAGVEPPAPHAEGEAGWRSGYPEYDGGGGVCHIPLDGHPDFMVVAFNSDGNLVDGCGDDVGYGLEDVERWQPVGSHPAPQVIFSDTQEEIEARLVDQLESSCPYCRGSGHKDDVAAPQVATETAIKSSPSYRKLHREKEHLLALLKERAPQVAVPEDAAQDRRIVSAMAADLGRIAEALDIDPDEGGAAPILAAINEMKSRCAVPSGWKPVPVEPTNEMISAGADASNAYRVDIMRSYDAMLAAAPTAPAGELVTRCTAGLGCEEKGHCDAAATGQGDMCDRRTMAHERPVSAPDGLPEPPFDAAHDARVFADRVEMKYGFRCQAGDIADCYEWQQLRQCLVAMAEYVDLAPDEREIAAKAIEQITREYFNDESGPHSLHDYLLWRAKRLRAGKEGEPS